MTVKSINERVKEIRKENGLTLEKFGDRLGVSKVAISLIENGKNNITEQMLKSICREFYINEEWLRYGTGEKETAMDKEDMLFEWAGRVLSSEKPTFQKRLVKALASLDEKDWEELERIALKTYDTIVSDTEEEDSENRDI